MQRAHPDEYNFIPQTWVIPAEYPLQKVACYYSYQRFWHVSEAYGSFSIELTHKPGLNAA